MNSAPDDQVSQDTTIKVSFPTLWVALPHCTILLTVMILKGVQYENPITNELLGILLLLFIASVLFLVILSFLFGHFWYFNAFSPSGFRGVNYWGTPTFIPWSEITHTQKITGIARLFYFLVPSTLIKSNSKRGTIWLFSPITRLSTFQNALKKYCPEGNPMRTLLIDL